jgi:hypothetical protein
MPLKQQDTFCFTISIYSKISSQLIFSFQMHLNKKCFLLVKQLVFKKKINKTIKHLVCLILQVLEDEMIFILFFKFTYSSK